MLGHSPFYHSTIRNVTGAFGALFNDISFTRVSPNKQKSQTIKVPLLYGSADKAFSRRSEDPTLNFNMQQVYPRMSFYLEGMSYDPDRKTTATSYTSHNSQYSFSPAPYTLEFGVYIATANIEDGLQIIEQIIPFFNPDYTISVNANPNLGLKKDVPICLVGISYNDPAPDSEYSDSRIIEWTLNFTAKVYFFGPTQSRAEIKHANLKLFENLPFGYLETARSRVEPPTANENEAHTIVDDIIRE